MEEEYLFNAKEMIDAFNMENFLTENDDIDRANGAFLIITDNQRILSYNKDFGKGLHIESMGNALLEIWGREKEEDELPFIFPESEEMNIMASLVNEPDMAYIIFHLDNLKSITPNQLELFKEFMNQYNEQFIRYSQENIDGFAIYARINNIEEEFDNLKPIYEYLKTIVDENKKAYEDVVILGDVLSNSKKK